MIIKLKSKLTMIKRTMHGRCGKELLAVKLILSKENMDNCGSTDFSGSLSDIECMKLIGLSRNTYYKYKKELTLGDCNLTA